MKKYWQHGVVGLILTALLATASIVQAEELIVYSGRKDKFISPLIKQFTAETGIKVVLHTAKSTALLNKLRIEGDRTVADLFISNDAGNLQTGTRLGLFQAIDKDLIKVIPTNLRADDDTWVGLSARARVLVVNTKAKDLDFVKSVFDLADPRLKGRLAITHSSNGSFIAGVTVYQQSTSESVVKDWLKGMKDNVGGKLFSKHSKIVAAVASGKKDVGLVNHYYIYRHLAKHPDAPIRVLIPDQQDMGMGVAWNVAGIGISKYTKKKALAEKLIAYLVSEKGQSQFAGANSEYPTRIGVPAAAIVPAAGSYKVADVPMRDLGTHRIATLDLLDAIGMP